MASSKIVLVTGGNNGIGYEIVKALLQSSKAYNVLLGSRSVEKGNAAVEKLKSETSGVSNAVELVQVDIQSDESIDKAVEHIKTKHGHLDVLINNAGANFDGAYSRNQCTLRERFNLAYDVNVSGTNVLTHSLIPLLLKSSDPRLLFIGGLSCITEAAVNFFPPGPQPAGWPKNIPFDPIGYRSSKTALNLLMLYYNHILKADGVKVWAVGPGMCDTDLGGMRGPGKSVPLPGVQHASEGSKAVMDAVEGRRDEDVGKFIKKDGGFVAW